MIVSKSIISDVRIRAHLWPGLFSGIMSCLVIVWVSHSCRVVRRLVTHRLLGVGNNKVGKSMERMISGIPKRQGLENWSKKVRIMVRLKGWF